MIIKFERSGGLPGITTSAEFDSEDLPSAVIDLVKKIMEKSIPLKYTPKGNDRYTYTIAMEDGMRKRTIVCDEDVQGDLKSLIKQLQKFSNKN